MEISKRAKRSPFASPFGSSEVADPSGHQAQISDDHDTGSPIRIIQRLSRIAQLGPSYAEDIAVTKIAEDDFRNGVIASNNPSY
jgi:hypothetical protein